MKPRFIGELQITDSLLRGTVHHLSDSDLYTEYHAGNLTCLKHTVPAPSVSARTVVLRVDRVGRSSGSRPGRRRCGRRIVTAGRRP